MIRIEIGPSKTLVLDLGERLDEVKKALTYTNESIQYQIRMLKKRSSFATGSGVEYYQSRIAELQAQKHVCLAWGDEKVLVVPSGLVPRLRNLLGEVEVVDERIRPKKTPGFLVQGKAPVLRPYQEEQLQVCLDAGQGTIESATGTGKTVIIQRLIQKLGLKTLVIVPTISILEQTVRRMEDYFGKGKVSQYGGGKKKIRAVTVACAPSILTSDPEDWVDVDVLIGDEIHHAPSETVSSIYYDFVPSAYYRYGFTATPYRADGADLAIEGAAFNIIHSYSIQQGIADGYLAQPRFVVTHLTKSDGKKHSNHVKSFQDNFVRNPHLNDTVVSHAVACLSKDKQVLILVKEREHGHLLASRLSDSVFVRAKEKVEEGNAPYVDPAVAVKDFNEGRLRCLIGTSVIGEGTDLLPVDVLIMLGGGGSKGIVMQNLGRGLRKVPGRKDMLLVLDYMVDVPQATALKYHATMRTDLYREIGQVQIVSK